MRARARAALRNPQPLQPSLVLVLKLMYVLRYLQALMDSPLARQSTRGTPADTDATLLCSFDSPGAAATVYSSSQPGEMLLGGSSSSPRYGSNANASHMAGSVVVAIDAQLAAALVPTLSRGYAATAVDGAGGYGLPAAGSVRFYEAPGDGGALPVGGGGMSAGPPAAAAGAAFGSVTSLPQQPLGPLERHSPFAAAFGAIPSGLPPTSSAAVAAAPAGSQEQQQQHQVSRLSRLSGAGSSSNSTGSLSSRNRGSSSGGGSRASRGPGPYSEALLSSPAHTPTAADAADVPASSQGAADWTVAR
jgi:hypothetical protein